MKLRALLKNKEVNNAGWLIGGKIIQMIFSLVVGALTARYLGPGNYGLINYGTAYVSFFVAIANLGINSVLVKTLIEKPEEQGQTIGSAIVLRIISSILSIVMIFGIVSILDRNEPTTILVVLFCSFSLLFNVFETFNYWFQSQYKSKVTAIASLIAYIITSGYKIVLLILNKDVLWFAFATSVDYIMVAVVLCIAYKRSGGARLSFSKQRSKELLSISYHYILSSMMVAIYAQTDKLMLKQMLNETVVGYYSTAVTLCGMWTFVLQAIIDSLYPTILRLKFQNQEAYEKKNRQLYAIVFYLSIFVSLCFTFLGWLAIKILYGDAYMPSNDILKVVTWYTAFSYLGVARNAWIVSEGHQKYLKYLYVSAAILNVLMNLIFIPFWGAVGAAVASLITQILTSIILPMFFKALRPNAKLMLEAMCLRKLR